jgi:hypothetical protein
MIMKAYVINTDTNKVLGRFASMDDAVKFADATDVNYTVVTDAKDISALLSRDEMVTIYNNHMGTELKKFSTKADGAKRVLEMLHDMQDSDFAPPKKKRASRKAERKPTEPGYKGHRNGSIKGKAHEYFDKHFGSDKKTRKDIIAGIEALEVQPSTASSWYQAFRRTALDERSPKKGGGKKK